MPPTAFPAKWLVLCTDGAGGDRRAPPSLSQRLCEVVRGPDVPETLSLLASGARVQCQSCDPSFPSPISLAENAGQALQTELLRHNEFTGTAAYISVTMLGYLNKPTQGKVKPSAVYLILRYFIPVGNIFSNYYCS